jgi:hypothetical protein
MDKYIVTQNPKLVYRFLQCHLPVMTVMTRVTNTKWRLLTTISTKRASSSMPSGPADLQGRIRRIQRHQLFSRRGLLRSPNVPPAPQVQLGGIQGRPGHDHNI